MTVIEYENKFTSLLRFALGIAKDEERKIEKFVDGLDLTIRPIVAASESTEYAKAVQKALLVKAESKDNKAIEESYKRSRGMGAFFEGQSSKKQKHEQSRLRGQQSVRSAPAALVLMVSSRLNVTCFRYGQLGHYKSQCTETQARVLFNSGALYSFIASSFARALGLEFDLIILEIIGFDVIFGMNWLSSFKAVIDCFRGKVSVCTPNGDCFCFVGDRCNSLTPLVYSVRGRDRQGSFWQAFFADDDVDFCGVDYPVVVRNFLDVFSEDLTELPLHREVKFAIDLMPSAI
ncbi:uncharacterized protein LOC132270303 [Cornus florida]|uniref:uncharacterized protein LOC132270303 n=1 Tax=Cornus florida TaxID=4283 RepID=UPI002899AC7B|nr:uncharacterized protein LOC132270303 [Cornus florida]